jgi:hypothetical protein
MVVLLVVLTAFAVSFRTLRQANTAYVRESRCVWVMDNTLERLAARGTVTVDDAQALLAEELAAMPMPNRQEVRPVVALTAQTLQLRLENARGRPIVAVEVPCP